MTKSNGLTHTYVVASGFLFAFLQTGLFFQLQFRLTSAYPSFLAVTLAWLVGSGAGLWLGRKENSGGRTPWLLASLIAYYLVLLLLRQFPYRMGWLPVYGLLIAVSGAQAGHFFAVNRALLPSAGQLFFWENNGFVLGWIAGFVGYIVFGNAFHWLSPLLAALAVSGLYSLREGLTRLTQERRNKLLLFLVGFNLILLNYTLIRQTTIAFRDIETSALLMALAYFAGVSLGYFTSDRIGARALRGMLPGFLLFQMLLTANAPVLVQQVQDATNTTVAYFVVFVLVMLGSASLYSFFLPRLVQSEADSTQRYYSVEIIGSLCALLSLPLLGQGGMGLFYAMYLTVFVGIAALLGARPWAMGTIILLSAVALLSFDAVDKNVSATYYRKFYEKLGIERVLFTRYSPYHKVEVLENQAGNRFLVLNAQMQFGPNSHENYSYFAAEYPARLMPQPPTVLLIGCGAMSTVGRMGDWVKSIAIVDLDQAVFETSKAYFPKYNRLGELRNWTFQSDDAKHFLATTNQKFDLIIDDIPPAKTRQVALTYTKEFFELVRSRLTPRGVFSLPSLTPIHSEREYGRRMLATLADTFDQVAVLNDGSASYYFATGPDVAFDKESLRAAIQHPRKDRIEILLPGEVREFVKGIKTITINNMADLILY